MGRPEGGGPVQFWTSPRRLLDYLARVVLRSRCISHSTCVAPRWPQQMPDLSTDAAGRSRLRLQRDVVERPQLCRSTLAWPVRPTEISAERSPQVHRTVQRAGADWIRSIRNSPFAPHPLGPVGASGRNCSYIRKPTRFSSSAVMMPRVCPSPHARRAAGRRTHA